LKLSVSTLIPVVSSALNSIIAAAALAVIAALKSVVSGWKPVVTRLKTPRSKRSVSFFSEIIGSG
jgi:hypothetical protein